MAWVRFVKPPAGEIWVYSCLNPQCISMAIFNSYVSLAEGKSDVLRKSSTHLGVSPSR